MKPAYYIEKLKDNQKVFEALLSGLDAGEYTYKPDASEWCILEIVCHLYDEEREDFRTRVRSILEDPSKPLPPADPLGWSKERGYMKANFEGMVGQFLEERKASVAWLQSLESPNWKNSFRHPKVGPISALLILTNWVVHDHLHIRQITKRKYEFLGAHSIEPIDYAGKWK